MLRIVAAPVPPPGICQTATANTITIHSRACAQQDAGGPAPYRTATGTSCSLTNHVLTNKQPFQTFQDAGKTIYIYEDSKATWVNGGVWYQINGNASLTSDQLLRIANSF